MAAIAALRATARHRGRIELVVGPMFSGKTTELFRRVNRYRLAGHSVAVVKSAKDTRGTASAAAHTHDGLSAPALPVTRLSDAETRLVNTQVVGVDEGQFYEDLEESCERLAAAGKVVIVAALDGTFRREPFLNVARLVAKCDAVTKLLSVCARCGADAAFSHRLSGESSIEVIGGADKYAALCRHCFHKANETTSTPL